MSSFVDISGTPLDVGDKVAVQYKQLFRIGEIQGFTASKVIVVFDFGAIGPELETAKLNPWRLAKVCNQNIGLQDYYSHIMS